MALHDLLQGMGPSSSSRFREVRRRQRHGRPCAWSTCCAATRARLTVLAPLNCASAATMLALGADTIAMGPLSYLTAVDTSLEHDLSPLDHTNNLVAVSNDEVERVIRLWKETAGRGTATSTRTRSCTSTFTPWSSAPSTAPAACRSCSAARSSATT